MARPTNWQEQIAQAGKRHQVSDPRLLNALLETQAGDDEIEFGQGLSLNDVGEISVPANLRGFTNQADLAAGELSGVESQYRQHTGQVAAQDGLYTPEFLEYFSQGGPGYDGYAINGQLDDPGKRTPKHLERLRTFYGDMTTNPQTGQAQGSNDRTVVATVPDNDGATLSDTYGQARVRSDELSLIERMFGPDVSTRVLHEFQRHAKDAALNNARVTASMLSFMGETVSGGLELLEQGGGYIRGALGGQPGETLTVEELTGLEPEPIDRERTAELLARGPLAAMTQYPNRAMNFVAEVATDPLGVLGGVGTGVKVAKKAGKAVKDAVTPTPLSLDAAQKRGKGIAAPGGPPQSRVDGLLKSTQAAIADAKTTKVALTREAKQLLDGKEVTLRKLLMGDVGQGGPAEAQAVAFLRQGLVKQLDAVAMNPKLMQDPALQQEFWQLLSMNTQAAKMARTKIEIPAGQTVQAARFGQGPALRSLEEVIENQPEGTPLAGLAYTYRLLKDGKERDEMFRQMSTFGQKVKGVGMQIMLNGLIAGLATPIWNVGAMTSLTAAKVFERWRMAKFSDSNVMPGESGVLARSLFSSYYRLMKGDVEVTKRWRESQNRFKGLAKGVDQADLDRMEEIKTLALNETDPVKLRALDAELGVLERHAGPGGGGKFNIRRTISSETFGQTGMMGGALDALGHAINIPTYIVGKTDHVFRFAVQTAFADAMAYRAAYQDVFASLKAGEKMSTKVSQRRLQARMQEMQQRPDRVTVEIDGQPKTLNQVGADEADLITMMQGLTGRAGQADDILRQSLIGRTFSPFFRVMALTAREGFGRTPVLQRMVPSLREASAKGGEAGARAKAQLSTGWAMGGLGVMLHESGMITGGGPTDRDARADWEQRGNKPYSIQIPRPDGTTLHIPYDRAAPIGNVLAFVADIAYMIPRLADVAPGPDESIEGKMAEEAVESIIGAMTHMASSTMVSGDLREFFGAFADADTAADNLQRLLAKKTAAFVPGSAFSRTFNQLLDGERKAADGALEQMQRVIPGMSAALTPYHSKWGEVGEMPAEGAWETALLVGGAQIASHAEGDPRNQIIKGLDRSRVTFGIPSRSIGGVRLNTQQYEAYKKLIGKGVWTDLGEFVGFEPPNTSRASYPPGQFSLTSSLHSMMFASDGALTAQWTRGTRGPAGGRQTLVDQRLDVVRQAAANHLTQVVFPELAAQALKLKGFGQVGPESLEDVQQAVEEGLLDLPATRPGAGSILLQ